MTEEEQESKRFVFVGLGNPGKKYAMTRHNIGFMVVKAFAAKHGFQLKEEMRFKALVAKGKLENADVHLVLPVTFMNLSGEAVRSYLDFYQINSRHLVVVNDDVAVPFGEMRLRLMGSSGGHNGLKSIELHLQTRHYTRLRMGIGAVLEENQEADTMPKAAREEDLAEYVLGNFSQEESKKLEQFVERGVRVLERFLTEDIHRVMNDANTRASHKILKSKTPGEGQENKHGSEETKSL